MKQQHKLYAVIGVILLIGGGSFGSFWILRARKLREGVQITHVNHACVLIEYKGIRIYTDPSGIPEEYSKKPADYIFVTHDHGDHWELPSVNIIAQETTQYFGAVKSERLISAYNFTVLQPGDEGIVGEEGSNGLIQYEAFPMYNNYAFSHERSNNYTGFIFTVKGYRIYIAGDTDLIEEHQTLANTLDVAIIPIPPVGYPMMNFTDALEFMKRVQPRYVIPCHYYGSDPSWLVFYITRWNSSIEGIYEHFPFVLP